MSQIGLAAQAAIDAAVRSELRRALTAEQMQLLNGWLVESEGGAGVVVEASTAGDGATESRRRRSR